MRTHWSAREWTRRPTHPGPRACCPIAEPVQCIFSVPGLYVLVWTCALHSQTTGKIYESWEGLTELGFLAVCQVHINPERMVPELSFENNAATCNLEYNGYEVYVTDCVVGNGEIKSRGWSQESICATGLFFFLHTTWEYIFACLAVLTHESCETDSAREAICVCKMCISMHVASERSELRKWRVEVLDLKWKWRWIAHKYVHIVREIKGRTNGFFHLRTFVRCFDPHEQKYPLS